MYRRVISYTARNYKNSSVITAGIQYTFERYLTFTLVVMNGVPGCEINFNVVSTALK